MITTTPLTRFMVFGPVNHEEVKTKTAARFAEVQSLVNTYGGRVEEFAYQNDARTNHSTYIGSGKIPAIIETLFEKRIEVLVVNDNVKPTQLYALQETLIPHIPGLKIWDRVDLILNIFNKHATTAEAKLQIKLADIRHLGPVLYNMGTMLSRQGGGVGTRGLGETNTEIEQRHFRQATQKIQHDLHVVIANRQRQIDERKNRGIPTVSLVGYTNAGKTSLFNRLTGKQKLVENALFATLDSSVGKVYLKGLNREVLITDTIGFIQDLPPQLVDAFTSTLLETVQADLILHIIDMSDPWMEEKIQVVENILKNLAIDTIRQVYVFNKMDLATPMPKRRLMEDYARYKPQFISVRKNKGIDQLLAAITETLGKNR